MIDAHQGAIEYDWRTRFRLSLAEVGDTMSWSEAVRLSYILRADPSSATAAAIEGWDHPISREALILMDQYDLDRQVAGDKRWKGYERPWKRKGDVKHHGNAGGRSRAEVVAIFNAHGHNIPA